MSQGDDKRTETSPPRRAFLCDCEGSMTLDVGALSDALSGFETTPCTQLCRSEIERLATNLTEAAQNQGEVIVACAQESAAFEEAAEAAGATPPRMIDIRDRAGWSDDPRSSAPKQAALLREALLPRPAAPSLPIQSAGLCLVYGAGAVAAPIAERLSSALGVTCMITDAETPTAGRRPAYDLVQGRIRSASGTLGQFALKIDAFAEVEPAARGDMRFTEPRDGARTSCDIIIDVSGGQPLFPAAHKRDGYLRADPGDPLAVERLAFEASQLVGEFEKPLYIRFEESLCAHSRARKEGCTRCLDLCPTGAIAPTGDHVAIDPLACAGCGACAAVCPSGAARYDDPSFEHLMRRIATLADAYRGAGGVETVGAPRLLIHDAEHGAEMIALAARYGRGLPADVLPLELSEIATFSHAALLGALAVGFCAVDMLLSPKAERDAVTAQIALAQRMAQGVSGETTERMRALEPADPDALCELLYAEAPAALATKSALPLGEPRGVARLAMNALAGETSQMEPVSLEGVEIAGGAPYGAVLVEQSACTLCLACVSLCPTGALEDNPDKPELRFTEDACIQCGICARSCPETAITLEPRFNLTPEALRPQVLKSEEPFACVECGALFGVKSTVERISEKLAGKNWMYSSSDNVRLIQMCDNCRVKAQYHGEDSPFKMGERPKVRTTDDYLRERDDKEGGNA